MSDFTKAYALLDEFKGKAYINGKGVLSQIGAATAKLAKQAILIRDDFPGSENYISLIKKSLSTSGVELLGEISGAKPNAPREDLSRITKELTAENPDVIISFGGGSTIDAAKAAEVLRTLGGSIDNYFGTGMVTNEISKSGKQLTPHVAVQTASSSAAHLTKYSNITDLATGQKKLIVDEAIIPIQPIFDYEITLGAPFPLTADGALDGISHSLEVLYGAVGNDAYNKIEQVAHESIRLVVEHLPTVLENPNNLEGREALGLATDLGGYSIMLGGTNGGHLTSFSLVDVLSHGRACAIMNPYYTVFFAPSIEKPLRVIGDIFKKAGYTDANIENLDGRDLGIAVAQAMISFQEKIGFPTTLGNVADFSDAHIERALTAAKNPQLKMKLQNMPVSLTADMVDEYMRPILLAAKTGDLSTIMNVKS